MCSEFNIYVGGVKASMWVRLCRKIVSQNVGSFESQKQLSAECCKDWQGLHESGYCYLKIYVGTHNLKSQLMHFQDHLPDNASQTVITSASSHVLYSLIAPRQLAFESVLLV